MNMQNHSVSWTHWETPCLWPCDQKPESYWLASFICSEMETILL